MVIPNYPGESNVITSSYKMGMQEGQSLRKWCGSGDRGYVMLLQEVELEPKKTGQCLDAGPTADSLILELLTSRTVSNTFVLF